MQQVSVKAVVFFHALKNQYYSLCPAIRCFYGRGNTVADCITIIRNDYLLHYLKNRNKLSNLHTWGWQFSENSILPPVYTDEYCVEETKKLYPDSVIEYQIINIEVNVPKAEI